MGVYVLRYGKVIVHGKQTDAETDRCSWIFFLMQAIR